MKESKCSITISRPTYGNGKEKIRIVVRDRKSRIQFLDLEIGYDDFAKAITGLSEVDCDATLNGAEKFGLKKEIVKVKAKMPDEFNYSNKKEIAYDVCMKECPDGFVIDKYFGSKNSFVTTKDGSYAVANAFRWVDDGDN